MEGERKRGERGSGGAGGGVRGQQAAAHQPHPIYTYTLRAGPGPQPRRSTHGAAYSLPAPPPPAPSHSSWKVELQELSICPPAYPSHCLEAASSMQPPGPLVSLPGCESRSRRGTMSSDTSALPPPQVDGKCKGQHRGSCSCMYMFVCPRVHMYVHVCMHK